MKKHSFISQIVIFSAIFLCFILPPFFVNSNNFNRNTFTIWNFPFQQMIMAIFAFAFFLFYIKDSKIKTQKDDKKQKETKFWNIYSFFTSVVFGVSILFFISLIFKIVSLKSAVSLNLENASNSIEVLKPSGFLQIFFSILTFLFSATYEEVIYRAYFTDALLNIFHEKSSNKILLRIIFEILGISVFAFAHFYAGILSVLNAAFAHCVLRMIYIYHKNIYGNIFAHCIYNILTLFVF